MSLEALRESLPAYAKDIATNLGNLAGETILSDQQKWGCFVAAAHAIGEPRVVKAVEAEAAQAGLSEETKIAAKAAAAIMAMNNIYYRAIHIMQSAEYRTLPAHLRMT
ncbi:MAG TPA: alkyl hydroperoxide reductase, partial [Caulobacteraceae bacterium]|nr:alkyl hydroperoxide reductase [Caulobacteraceae bacterium]